MREGRSNGNSKFICSILGLGSCKVLTWVEEGGMYMLVFRGGRMKVRKLTGKKKRGVSQNL
jgi:hypothetical protein